MEKPHRPGYPGNQLLATDDELWLDPNWERDERGRVGGYRYTCPYVGNTRTIYPVTHPDLYPDGWHGPGNIWASYAHPDAVVRSLMFDIQREQEHLRKDQNSKEPWAKYEIEERQVVIDRLQAKIDQLKTPAFRVAEARRLLAHKSAFLDKLTPWDRWQVEQELLEYRQWIAEWEARELAEAMRANGGYRSQCGAVSGIYEDMGRVE